ncbi:MULTISPECIES: FKBP-type peptidyl-prolyl cis-trans isomerase [unclassified Pseudomonas]|uniref:FKBP-type peptidyl-prolyl cis-trans isomerase n=1 Tax=unclassified Pseudomonas TaxID=196821 RepID=UPI002AC92164|nr:MULTISPECIES: FKBP-type peptidyl-prolyl cis-trans isomerase [unclassified Pseudomonas]MEB0041564.1 FKBP-type peptidyl-prolyl cis-trans isomerase [Pseudomonas sp. MH10]MEB0077461.1 FKBP-type peptidyl-prolyl cis-trans isomerase [Pseudomonas sp. MH10out]MEB0092308.1 FKBP-type peptidyl-prolyl cis-trans isomerase [Pseudomonas sp. CCI4.2]MEB0101085.1 FKBP-type peptidyl-prolyl cis-trans isomerase [Pseudomonas sp. CCI3.2]MEB0123103.1 FKBP-type peptidyl-prolyl cis-trans isomerase [Pseudomonas sp. CC
MSRYLLMSLFLLLPLAQAAETAAPASDHDLAYSLGASLGQRLRQEVPDLQIQALIDGLQQAYQGKPLALKDERIEQILRDHDAAVTQSEEAPAPEPQSEAAMSTEQRFLALEKAKPGVQVLADGVLMTELKAGTGVKPTASDRVQVRYVGRLPDGTIFDQNTQPQWFRLDSVIAGWTSALQGMQVGAKWRLVIPSAQAYGAEGAGDLIDPYTPLVFEIELLDVAR